MNNNNTLTEVLQYLVAIIVIVSGGTLLYLGKIDFPECALFLTAGLGIIGAKFLASAPSPTQQSQLTALVGQLATQQSQQTSLASQQSDVISKMVDQQVPVAPVASPQPDPQPGQRYTTQVPQPAAYNPPVQQFVQQPQQVYSPPPPYVDDGRDWSGMVPVAPSISLQPTQRIPTP